MLNEIKGLAAWLTFASALVVAFFGIRQYAPPDGSFKPPPPPPNPAYTVTLIPPGDFQEMDARKKEEVPVVFRLDRPPVDGAISVGYRIEGDDPADFEVVNLPGDGRIRFAPGGGPDTTLKIRRLPGPRGLGDRKVVVKCLLDPKEGVTLAPGGLDVVVIRIADPLSRLVSWKVDPHSTRLTAILKPPRSQEVNLSYRLTVDNETSPQVDTLTFEKPADPWLLDHSPTTVDLKIPPPRLVFTKKAPPAGGRKVRIELDPPFSDPPNPIEFTLDPEPSPSLTGGSVLVMVLLSHKLTDDKLQEIQKTLDSSEARPLRDKLVNRTVFLLNSQQELVPLDSVTLAAHERKRFGEGVKVNAMLGKWSREIVIEMNQRLPRKRTEGRALVVYDVDMNEQDRNNPNTFISGGLIGTPWTIFWVAPTVNKSLEEKLREVIDSKGWKLEVVRTDLDLSKSLLEFLKIQPGG